MKHRGTKQQQQQRKSQQHKQWPPQQPQQQQQQGTKKKHEQQERPPQPQQQQQQGTKQKHEQPQRPSQPQQQQQQGMKQKYEQQQRPPHQQQQQQQLQGTKQKHEQQERPPQPQQQQQQGTKKKHEQQQRQPQPQPQPQPQQQQQGTKQKQEQPQRPSQPQQQQQQGTKQKHQQQQRQPQPQQQQQQGTKQKHEQQQRPPQPQQQQQQGTKQKHEQQERPPQPQQQQQGRKQKHEQQERPPQPQQQQQQGTKQKHEQQQRQPQPQQQGTKQKHEQQQRPPQPQQQQQQGTKQKHEQQERPPQPQQQQQQQGMKQNHEQQQQQRQRQPLPQQQQQQQQPSPLQQQHQQPPMQQKTHPQQCLQQHQRQGHPVQAGDVQPRKQLNPHLSHSKDFAHGLQPMYISSTAKPIAPKSGHIARGTFGKSTIIETNYLELNIDKMPSFAYHYDVSITPERPKKFLRAVFDMFNKKYFNGEIMAYDGRKSVYTLKKLPQKCIEGEIEFGEGRPIGFKIQIKETLDLEVELQSLRSYHNNRVFDKPMRALQCLEVILASPCHNSAVRAVRSFYRKPDKKYDLRDGYEMWIGLFQACILGDSPFFNVDISHKSFPSAISVLQYLQLKQINWDSTCSHRSLYDISSFLKELTIVYEPPKMFGGFSRNYRVIDVSPSSALDLLFTLENGKKKTVAAYFAQRGYTLQYPKLNCLIVGSSVKAIFLPMELCSILPGQVLNKKDSSNQVQEIIKYSATKTTVRKSKIIDLLKQFNHNNNATIQAFGIKLGTNFIEVPMRIIPSPKLQYLREIINVHPLFGNWQIKNNTEFFVNMKSKSNKYFKWAVIYSEKSRMTYHDIHNLAEMMQKIASDRKIPIPKIQSSDIQKFRNIDDTLKNFSKNNYDLVFVIIPNLGTTYADIKQVAELKYGILTQCIKEVTVIRRLQQQTIQNILLKVNSKLNGINHIIVQKEHVVKGKVMFLGADVTHPSPDQRNIPSIVGTVASHDLYGVAYNMQFRLQKSTLEEIDDMESIFREHLKFYKSKQGCYPNHIFYYRDGVSDGQFPIIKKVEILSLRRACRILNLQSVNITCIIVVKRHHTRFFPRNSEDKFQNVPPGTVVDQKIVHPNEKQFFMVNHQSIQGTAKPTRYNIIEDDTNMNIDDLQKLTHYLCHLFPRCNRSVSYPAPAYLAHLVAARGRVYIEGVKRFGDPKKDNLKYLVNENILTRNPMFYI